MFDEDNPLHSDDSNYVLSTEGHILSLDRTLERPISTIRRELRRVEHLECPAYRPPLLAADEAGLTGLTTNIYGRYDIDYSRQLIMAPTTDVEESLWSFDGECRIPKVDLYVSYLRSSQSFLGLVLNMLFVDLQLLAFCGWKNCRRGSTSWST